VVDDLPVREFALGVVVEAEGLFTERAAAGGTSEAGDGTESLCLVAAGATVPINFYRWTIVILAI
jgi:hypothetical protein